MGQAKSSNQSGHLSSRSKLTSKTREKSRHEEDSCWLTSDILPTTKSDSILPPIPAGSPFLNQNLASNISNNSSSIVSRKYSQNELNHAQNKLKLLKQKMNTGVKSQA